MTLITSDKLAVMHSRRQRGESAADIARDYGLKEMTVYQRLRRTFGSYGSLPGPANDNNPHRVTRMTAHNGGCSSVSGMMPVTLARVPTIDGLPEAEQVAA